MKKLLVFCYTLLLCTLYSVLCTTPKPVSAQVPGTWKDIGQSVLGDPNRCVSTDDVAYIQGFECLFVNVVRILTPIVGIALFIMLIVGSFQLLTSGGDPKQIQKAQKTLTSAIIGIVVFFGVWFILTLIHYITGVEVTKFIIPGP